MKREEQILIILNPAARGDRAGKLQENIGSLSPQAVVRCTQSRGEATRLAEEGQKEGFRTIVAAGGDGTVNEVVNGLSRIGGEAVLGVLPLGTMNVFATEMGLPADLSAAWAAIEQGSVRSIDLPRVNDQYFVQLAGAGLDAAVVERTSPNAKRALGPISYLLTLAQIAHSQPPGIHIAPVDSPARTGSFVLVGNGRLYGGPFVLFKEAKPDDGLLDVLVFQNQSPWDLMRYVQAIAFGSHADLPDIAYFQTSGLHLSSHERVPVEIDGEGNGVLPSEISISPHKLRVHVL